MYFSEDSLINSMFLEDLIRQIVIICSHKLKYFVLLEGLLTGTFNLPEQTAEHLAQEIE
jgi:hypothetical protein